MSLSQFNIDLCIQQCREKIQSCLSEQFPYISTKLKINLINKDLHIFLRAALNFLSSRFHFSFNINNRLFVYPLIKYNQNKTEIKSAHKRFQQQVSISCCYSAHLLGHS